MKRWLKRAGFGLLILIGAAVATGMIVEQWARYRARRDFPAPGKLVDIGGRRIQIDCRGSGSPTVVFEAGAGPGGSTDWTKVQDDIAQTTRACSYSRAGILWSDPATGPRDGNAVVADLHATLVRSGERAPFVLVGWSLGGPFAVLYTQHYGSDVAGLVLVDPSHPDQTHEIEAISNRPYRSVRTMSRVIIKLSWTGVLRLAELGGYTAKAAFLPGSVAASFRELDSEDQTLAEVAAAHDLGNRPLVVLTAMAPYSSGDLNGLGMSPEQGRQYRQAWKRLHDNIATWSVTGRNVLVPDASHDIPEDDPQALISAVNAVVTAVRDGNATMP